MPVRFGTTRRDIEKERDRETEREEERSSLIWQISTDLLSKEIVAGHCEEESRQIRSEFFPLKKKKRVAIKNSRLLSWLFFCLQFVLFVHFAGWFVGNLRCTVYSYLLFNNTVIVICESIYCTTSGPRRRVSRIFRDIVCVDALSGYGVLWLSSHGSRLRFSIGTCCLCDERGLMVDPLKLFWVITNSTYLGTSSDTLSISLIIVICLLRYKITYDTLAKPSRKNRRKWDKDRTGEESR